MQQMLNLKKGKEVPSLNARAVCKQEAKKREKVAI
jgi:hypothetical protein